MSPCGTCREGKGVSAENGGDPFPLQAPAWGSGRGLGAGLWSHRGQNPDLPPQSRSFAAQPGAEQGPALPGAGEPLRGWGSAGPPRMGEPGRGSEGRGIKSLAAERAAEKRGFRGCPSVRTPRTKQPTRENKASFYCLK